MAPEIKRDYCYNESTDVYAFGVCLYEVVCGRRPFHLSENTFEAITAALNMGIPRPREVRSSVSARLEAVIMRALAQRPDLRYPSFTLLLDDLGEVTEADI
jgi:serine/threonine-protein kinase